jgi:hypothetical protein
MASEDAVASGGPDFSGNPVDAAYGQGVSMDELRAQLNEVYNNPNLGYAEKADTIESLLAQANAINPVSNRMSGEQYLLNMDAQNRGETTSGPYNGPDFGNFTGFALGDYQGPTSTNEPLILSGQAEEDATKAAETKAVNNDRVSNADSSSQPQTSGYYSDLINQMAGNDKSDQTKGNQYAENVGDTLSDAQDFGAVNIFEEPPIKDETFDRQDRQDVEVSNVLNAIDKGLNNNPDTTALPSREASLPLPVAGNPRAVGSAAEQWAAQGKLDSFLAANPDYAKTINNSFWDNLTGSYMSQLQDKNKAALAPVDASANSASTTTPSPFGALAQSNTSSVNTSPSNYTAPDSDFGSPGVNSALGAFTTSGPQGALGTTPSPYAGTTPMGAENTSKSNVVTLDYANPDKSYQIGGSQDLLGQFTVNGPVAYKNGLSNPYGDTTPLYDEPATTSNTSTTSANTGPLTVSKPSSMEDFGKPKVLDVAENGQLTDMSSTSYTKDTATSSTGYDKNTTPDTSGLPFGTGSPIGIDPETTYTTPETTPVTPAVTPVAPASRRKYLGTSDNPYRYGFGSERQYYGIVPAAAKGGYFDAERYFADGGMVQPLSPPTTPLVSAQPTMAFTDGAGSVGSIAQPPGLSQLDSFGSDAPHASPMAPSVAAAVPSFQPGLATLATPNVNAGPSPSPIAQNPNVRYALGKSPLSNLAGS